MPQDAEFVRFADVMKKGRLKTSPKKQVIQSTNHNPVVNMIVSGFVKRYMINDDGTLSVQSIYGPGDVFPLTLVYKLLFDQQIYGGGQIYYYETIAPSRYYSLPAEEFQAAFKNEPQLYSDLLSIAGTRFHSNIQQLENLGLKNARHKVAHQLAYYAQRFGRPTLDGTKVLPNLTHNELAEVLSLTRETVSIAISELRKEGLIKTGKSIVIPDIKKLKTAAYSI